MDYVGIGRLHGARTHHRAGELSQVLVTAAAGSASEALITAASHGEPGMVRALGEGWGYARVEAILEALTER